MIGYVVMLGALTALAPFTIDTYLPALPAIVTTFRVTDAAIQQTLAGTLVGFAIGQLLIGPWSDRVGRRMPLLVGTATHIAASLFAFLAPTVHLFFAARVLQGFGAAAAGVVAMAMVRDLFTGYPLVKTLSRLALVSGVAPLLAPLIGSEMLVFVDWRGIFVFLSLYGVAALVAARFLLWETLPREIRLQSRNVSAVRSYAHVLRSRSFIGLMLIGGMRFTALFAYLQASPFLLQHDYGLTPQQFGYFFALNSVGMIIGVQSSARLAKRIGAQWILVSSVLLLVLSGIAIALAGIDHSSLWVLEAGLFCFIVSCGLGLPMIQALALVAHEREAGAAAALIGASNFGLAGILSPLVAIPLALGLTQAVSLGFVIIATSVISVVALGALIRPWRTGSGLDAPAAATMEATAAIDQPTY
ncbi:multidrug effflux MFS transporter [soil metagenome]